MKAKMKLKDLVAASYVNLTADGSPYANLRLKYSPKKLEAYLASLSEEEKEAYDAYLASPAGIREMKEIEAKERQAEKMRAQFKKNRLLQDRTAKLKLATYRSALLQERYKQVQTLSLNEIAESLILFPELLPSGHKAQTLVIARKHFKAILVEAEKEYLHYAWVNTEIPVELCYSDLKTPQTQSMVLQ